MLEDVHILSEMMKDLACDQEFTGDPRTVMLYDLSCSVLEKGFFRVSLTKLKIEFPQDQADPPIS